MTEPGFKRTVQCSGCPWKVENDLRDIPNGICRKNVERLLTDRARGLHSGFPMACHDTEGAEQACVGWLLNQLGRGNNIALRIAAARGAFNPAALVLDGEQHETVDDMCAVLSLEEDY